MELFISRKLYSLISLVSQHYQTKSYPLVWPEIKHGAIIDAPFFDWIETNIEKLRARDVEALTYAVLRSCEIKANVVRGMSGKAVCVPFSISAIPLVMRLKPVSVMANGCTVKQSGCGMVMAADLSHRLGYIDFVSKTRITKLVEAAGLPTVAPDLGEATWLDLMEVDKKNEGGQIKFILLKPLGTSFITTVPLQYLRDTLRPALLLRFSKRSQMFTDTHLAPYAAQSSQSRAAFL